LEKRIMLKTISGAFGLLLGSVLAASAAEPLTVVAAENFYGEVASAVGGSRVTVQSILTNPDTDPHDFEPTPSTARDVARATVVILSGADYDPWMNRLVEASRLDGRVVIDVAALIGRKAGDNPHVWYDVDALSGLANRLADTLSEKDPAGAADYRKGRDAYIATLAPIRTKIAEVKGRFAGAPVAATEPVFGYMADALGLKMRNNSFQLAVMNDTEPSARDTAAFESDIKGGKIKVLFYNSQVTDPQTEHLLALAKAARVPVVGVTETKPEGKSYAEWMTETLDATAKALAGPST
jgi:zinc/manganese transport system substrate-binding protein